VRSLSSESFEIFSVVGLLDSVRKREFDLSIVEFGGVSSLGCRSWDRLDIDDLNASVSSTMSSCHIKV
jgi:hypothetical protein